MNKQRKVLITITYNEVGIIIDTKAEEVAQPKRKPVIRCWCPKCGFEMIPTIDGEMKGEAGGE